MMAPPTPMLTVFFEKTAVRMTIFKSAQPFKARYPMEPGVDASRAAPPGRR